jgi:hypothetical protein
VVSPSRGAPVMKIKTNLKAGVHKKGGGKKK